MDQVLSRIFADFASNPVAGGKAMRRLLETEREHFLQNSLPILRLAPQTQAFNYLLTLLLTNDLILEPLTNPDLFSFDEAVTLARCMLKIEPLLDIKMVRTLLDTKDLSSREELEKRADNERCIRLLEIMAAISDGARILPVMAQLLRHPNSKVRSKAALLVGRSNKNYQWVEQRLAEGDPRVRANALESMWGVDSEGARQVLWTASADPDNRVAGNAVYGLYLLGDSTCVPFLLQMLKHPQEDFRATSVWVMGESGDPRFLPVLASLMGDPQSKIRAAVFRGIAKLKKASMKFAAQPRLQLHLGPIERMAGGWRELRVSVGTPNGPGEQVQPVPALKPTQFVISEAGALVSEYETIEHSHTEALSIAYALPRIVETNDAWHQTLKQAFSGALRHKRKIDAWLTLRYACEKPVEQVRVNRSSKSILPIDGAQPEPADLTLPPDLRFSTEAEAILSAVANPGSRLSSATSMAQAVQILLGSIASTRGSRHLILLYQSSGVDLSPEVCHEIGRTARTGKICVHAIAPEANPALKELCARTGGFWVEKPAQELPGALAAVCANLIGHYLVRFRSEAPEVDTAGVKVQVFAEQGFGEETFGLMPQPDLELVTT